MEIVARQVSGGWNCELTGATPNESLELRMQDTMSGRTTVVVVTCNEEGAGKFLAPMFFGQHFSIQSRGVESAAHDSFRVNTRLSDESEIHYLTETPMSVGGEPITGAVIVSTASAQTMTPDAFPVIS